MKHLLQFNRFIVLLVAMLTMSLTSAWGQTYTFTSKSWADANKGWTSDKDGYQYSSPNVQVTAAYTGAGATSKASFTDITKISVKASTTSKGVGNITVKVGDGTAQTICSLSKNTTATDYSLEFATPVSGKVTFVVNCSTNSMYMQSITITSASGYDIEYECNGATSGCPEKATNQTALPDPLPTGVQKTGFNFAGWFTNEGLSTQAVAGAEITAKTTLYAKWDEIVTPTVSLNAATIDFGTVYKDAVVSAKTIGATLINTSAATASITGSAFAINPTDLSVSGDITITPNTATIGEYSDTLTLAATGATDAVATIKMNVVEQPVAKTFNLVKDVTALYVGQKIIIVNSGVTKALSTTQNSNNRGSVTVTEQNNSISVIDGDGVQVITLGKDGDNWTLGVDGGYLFAASSSSNYLRTQSSLDNNGKWAVSISDNVASFTAQGSNTRNQLKNNGDLFSCYASGQTAVKIYAEAVSSVVSKASGIKNGDVDAKVNSASVIGQEVTSGTIVTLSNTPESAQYKLKAYKVFKTDEEATTVAVTDSKFTMPAYAVTISAEFEKAKVLDTIKVSGTYKTEFWKGETFDKSGVVVTAYYDDQTNAEVTSQASFSSPDMTLYNQDQTVTVSYKEGTITKATSYTITVKTIANTKETAYTGAEAIALYNAGKDLTTEVFVKGIITSLKNFDGTNGTYNIYIKDEDDADVSFEYYKCLNIGGTKFAEGDLTVNDTVIAKGTLTKYSSQYEFAQNCQLVERKAYIETPCDIHNTPETAYTASEAKDIVDQGECLDTRVYVKGVVSKVNNLSDGKLNIFVTDEDGQEFEYYRCWNIDSVAFTAVSDIQVYDTLIALGTMTKWQQTYEFNENCVLISRKAFVPHVLSVSLNSKAETIAANGSVQLSATVLPEDAPDKSVTWSVIEGATLVSVEDGLVSGLNAGEGTATVRVTTTDGGFTDDCVITITAAETRKTASITGFTATEGALTPSDITYKGEQGGASTKAAIYNNGLRLYQNGGYVTIAAAKGCKIDEVIITTNATYSTTAAIATTRVKPTSGVSVAASSEKSFGTGMNADTAFVFCLGTTSSSRLELASIVVKYTGEPLSIDTIKVSGEYQTEFQINDEFNHDGAIVTAYYSDKVSSAVVTSAATFSDPDMTTTGEKTVTVSYGGKQTSYAINVVPATLDTIRVSGNYQKVFSKDDTFSHDGAVVTAYYSDETSADVTADAEFIAPDMTTFGSKQVVVNYGGKSTSYAISVKSKSGDLKSELVDFTVVYASVTSNKEVEPYSGTSFDMNFKKKAGSNTPTKYYNEGTSVRNYAGDTIIISAVDNIYMVEIQFTDIKGIDTNPTVSEGTMTIDEASKLGTWILDGTSKEVRYICGSTSSFSTIKVWYARPYVRESTVDGNYGVVCLPMAVAAGNFQGAEVFKIVEKDANVKNLTIETVESMEAGRAYIILSNAETFTCMMTGDAVTTAIAAADNYGLAGTLTGTSFTGDGSQYVIVNNKVMKAGQVNIGANKAWIEMESVPAAGQGAPQRAGSRRITLGSNGVNTPTGLDALFLQEGIQKMMINGQVVIIRNGQMYNAQGQIVK